MHNWNPRETLKNMLISKLSHIKVPFMMLKLLSALFRYENERPKGKTAQPWMYDETGLTGVTLRNGSMSNGWYGYKEYSFDIL